MESPPPTPRLGWLGIKLTEEFPSNTTSSLIALIALNIRGLSSKFAMLMEKINQKRGEKTQEVWVCCLEELTLDKVEILEANILKNWVSHMSPAAILLTHTDDRTCAS